MKIHIFSTLFLILISNLVFTQSPPQFFNYQAIAHDNNGDILQGKELNVIITILSDSLTGSTTYEETHNAVITNSYGLFNLKIGGGTVNSGTFSSINWKQKINYLKIQIDADNGYELLGIHQFGAVPYAKAAERVMYPTLSSLVDHTPVDGQFSYFNELGMQSTVIYGWKTSGSDIYSTILGNLGLGTQTPDSKLDVDGTITLSNATSEINTSATGAANMLPIAYGVIMNTGLMGANSGNISCAWNSTYMWYEITITGENYNWTDYVTLVTSMDNSIDKINTSSNNNNLVIILSNNSGVTSQGHFSFVTYKP